MSTLAVNGVEIHVQVMEPADGAVWEGPQDPPTFVMIHGLGTDSLASWYFTLAKPFSEAGMRLVMYDLRGHGHSDRPPTGYQLDNFVDDLEGLLAGMGVTSPVHLIGNSFGGTIAFAYALRRPDAVAGIAVIESEPATEAWAKKMAHNLGRAAKQLPREEALNWISANRGRRTARLARAAGKMLSSTTLAQDIPASRVLSEAEISGVACPVLCLYGENSDLVVQAPVMERLLPRVRTVIVPGQHHSILVEMPDFVRELVLTWLREDCAVAASGERG